LGGRSLKAEEKKKLEGVGRSGGEGKKKQNIDRSASVGWGGARNEETTLKWGRVNKQSYQKRSRGGKEKGSLGIVWKTWKRDGNFKKKGGKRKKDIQKEKGTTDCKAVQREAISNSNQSRGQPGKETRLGEVGERRTVQKRTKGGGGNAIIPSADKLLHASLLQKKESYEERL